MKIQCLYCCLGWGHCVLERGIRVLIPFLIWVVNFEWGSGNLIQLSICDVNYCQNLYLHPIVIKAKRCISISDPDQNTHLIHLVICIISSHLLASCYSQLLVNTVSLAATLLSICLDRRTQILVCCFTDLWQNAMMLRCAFYQHPTADILVRWIRF